MADIQDSSGLPLSGRRQLSKEQQERYEKWRAAVFEIANQAAAQQLTATSRTLGRSDERAQAEMRDLRTQIQALRAEVKGLREYAHELKLLVEQDQQWREDVLQATTAAKADVLTIQRTIDRLNWMIEAVQVLAQPLDAVNKWLSELMRKIHQLDERTYSRKDGKEITGLVSKDRRTSDRNL